LKIDRKLQLEAWSADVNFAAYYYFCQKNTYL